MGKVGLPEAVLNKPGPGTRGSGRSCGPTRCPGPDVAGSKSLGSAVDLPGLHASLHERSPARRAPRTAGPRTTWGSVDSLARAIP